MKFDNHLERGSKSAKGSRLLKAKSGLRMIDWRRSGSELPLGERGGGTGEGGPSSVFAEKLEGGRTPKGV